MLSLQLAHQLVNKHVLLVGCGNVGMTRVLKLIPTGCKLTIVSPSYEKELNEFLPKSSDGSNVELPEDFINHDWTPEIGQIYRLLHREFQDSDIKLHRFEIVLTCIPNETLSTHIYKLCKLGDGAGVLCNVADVPTRCDFYFGSNCLLGNNGLQVMISSNGVSPTLTTLLKQDIVDKYGDLDWDEMCRRLGNLRAKVRELSSQMTGTSKAEVIKYRMEWVKKVTSTFGISGCSKMNVDKLCSLFETMALQGPGKTSLDFPETLKDDYTSLA
ncbi:HCL323Cp [Eremothecium sinecaudum]|uniref:precorrin-2 dehydrogenase n=1 Tax=Eremothecium sinecaudum TaxID=45286 RepID=A0A109UYF0_9SACH|nr:HCL323Cp [Eremothecium sinecaudum]AMD19828.1 HCL323Cp [Eremothecium sinecaudum]